MLWVMIKTSVMCVGVLFDVGVTFKSPPVCQREHLVSSPCLSMIAGSAGERGGTCNYSHIGVKKKDRLGAHP